MSKIVEQTKAVLKNWQCTKCRTLVKQAARPNYNGCAGGELHKWNDLGRLVKPITNAQDAICC